MSGMNLAFDTRMTRYMYFTLQGYDIRDPLIPWGLHRCGDILAGVLSKTVIDNFVFAGVHSGEPYVYHERASDPKVNLVLEQNTYDLPQILAERIQGATSYMACAERLFGLHVQGIRKDYFRHLSLAMRAWYELCKGEPGEYASARSTASRGSIQESEDAITSSEGLAEGEVVP